MTHDGKSLTFFLPNTERAVGVRASVRGSAYVRAEQAF
jgi:hypothetical protein